ncbi:MAG: cupredoxin domain-containing protein [Bdellovibrionota bacterium]
MSRRKSDFQRIQETDRQPASEVEEVNLLSRVMDYQAPTQDIVILNTNEGFVPDKVYLNKGQKYNFHIVNVNEKSKNVSFMLDAFGENHNTVFGLKKSFEIKAKKDGVFTFLCPETTFQGNIIVVDKDRKPASE